MITATQHQSLIDECKTWYDHLASYSVKVKKMKSDLYFFAPGKTDHDTLLGVEHFHNQFHIQLINIHDLKRELKHHIHEANAHPTFGHRIPHHHIKEKLDALVTDLDMLEQEFNDFVSAN
ncbi:MAG: hypothetical protein JST86_14550 [Bacteroidetes bacterium]|nr:hypothetical protein [Bacteroidota bacterium]